MKPPIKKMTDNEQFIEREIAESLRNFLSEGNGHALVLGHRGTGKTTLMKHLADKLTRSEQIVAYVSLADVATANRLVGSIVRELLSALDAHYGSEQKNTPQISAVRDLGARLIHSPRSDAAEVLGRFFELLRHAVQNNEKIVIMLDGLDDSREPSRIALLLERLVRHEQPGLAVVVTSPASFETERLQATGRFASFTLAEFTQAEAERLLSSLDYDSPAIRDQILSVANRNPLLLRLLVSALQVYGRIPETKGKPEVLIQHYIDLAINHVVLRSANPDATRLVLTVIAMFQPVSQISVAEKTGIQLDQVRTIIDSALEYGMLVTDSDGNLTLGHVAFCEQLLTTYFGATEIDLRQLTP